MILLLTLIKIEPLKENFFTNKESLSLGNLNNGIVFLDNNEQPKGEIPQFDSEKSKKIEKEKYSMNNQKKEIESISEKRIFEEKNNSNSKEQSKQR